MLVVLALGAWPPALVGQEYGFEEEDEPGTEGARQGAAIVVEDAMVHFDLSVVASCLPEIRRVLVPGGHAFLHHSNYAEQPGEGFEASPHWRNHMSLQRFAEMSRAAGLYVLSADPIDWGQEDELYPEIWMG